MNVIRGAFRRTTCSRAESAACECRPGILDFKLGGYEGTPSAVAGARRLEMARSFAILSEGVVLGLVFSVLGGGVASAANFLTPNSAAIIELPLENEPASTMTAMGVRIVASIENAQPAGIAASVTIDEGASDLGPANIEVGSDKAKTFRIRVVADGGVQDGTFDVRLHPTFESTELFVSPDPENPASDTLVSFAIASPDSSTRTA